MLACNRRPTWSPDSKYIAFVSDYSGARHLTVMNNNGSAQRTLEPTEKQLSPSRAVKTIGEEQSMAPLWVLKMALSLWGRDLYQFNNGKWSLSIEDSRDIQYSPDGKIVYFRNDKGIHKQYLNSGSDSLIAKLPENCMNVQISRDGHWLTYIVYTHAESELRVRNILSGEDRLLAASIARREFSEHYVLTPDSKAVIVGFGGKLHSIDLITCADRIILFKAHVKVDLGALNYHTFRVTQDSFQVSYIRSANTQSQMESTSFFQRWTRIYTMELPDGKPKILVSQQDGQFQPNYSPDGKWIAYVTLNDTQGGFLWRVSSSGGRPEKMTTISGYYLHPAWSPDGSIIAVVRQDPQKEYNYYNWTFGQLQIIPAKGGKPRLVAGQRFRRQPIIFYGRQQANHFHAQWLPVESPTVEMVV